MLTFRPTKMLARQIGAPPPEVDVPIEAVYTDWCAHVFTVRRFRYLIFTHTYSFLSVVTAGRGITSDDALIGAAMASIRNYLTDSGRAFAFERWIGPATAEVRWARIPDRRVMGTINELVFQATLELDEGGLSPLEASDRLNQVPLSALWNRGDTSTPGSTFDAMRGG